MSFLALLLAEVVEKLEKLLIFLEVCLEFVNGLLRHLIKFIVLLADRSDPLDNEVLLVLFRGQQLWTLLLLLLLLLLLFPLFLLPLPDELNPCLFLLLEKQSKVFIVFLVII